MKKRVNTKELLRLLRKARAEADNFVEMMGDDTNPLILEMKNKQKGKSEAFNDVIWALEGDAIMMKISAGEAVK